MKSLLLQAFEFLFGCNHQLSRVFTIRSRTYQVCIDCGKEFGYSWELMRSLPSADIANAYAVLKPMRIAGSPGELIDHL